MKFLSDLLAKAGLTVDGVTQLNTVANATTDTDKFLVSDGGVVKYRTGAQLGSDIGPGNLSVSTVKHLVKLGEAATKGQAVYVSSADGTNMIVSKASNASEPTSSKTLGLLETGGILNDQVYVVTEGLLSGLNTATANVGDPVWLGTNGEIIYGLLNRPYAPAHLVFIGIVTRVQQNNGEIFVKVQNGFELQELHNVQITTTPSDNTVLSYETSTSLYKMKSIATLLGYTPLSGSGTTNYLPKWTGTTALGNSLIYDNGSAIGINTSSPFSSSAFKLDVNGGVLIKNTNGTAAQLVLIDSDPAAGGNNGFVQLTAGGNTSTAFGQWQTYYGTSIASGVLRLQPAGGYVLIGSSTAVTGAGVLQVSGDVNITGSFKINGVTLASGGVTSFNTRTGAITLSSSDVTTALGFTPISSYTETDTLASVTSRGASTSLAITALKFSQTSHSTTLSNSSYSNEAAVYANAGSGANVYPGYGFHKSGELGLFLYATNRSTLRMRGDDGSDNLIYHSGNLTNLNQLTNGPGYITSYTEVDTLASVTGRGASTSTNVTFNGTLTSAGQTILAGAFRFYTGGTDGSTAYGDFRTNPATGNSIISAKSNALYFNYDHGTGGVIFCDGATGIVATVNAAGVAVFNGNVTGASFIKSGGTSSQFLKADGSVDSSTYLTTGTASSTYLPLVGGTMTGQLLSPSMGTGVYEGAIQLRETGYVGSGQSAWGYAPAITFHWGNRWVKRFGGRYDGLFAIDDEPIALQSWVNSQGYVVSSSSSFTTAGTGWYRVATTAGDGRGYYYVELYCTGGNHNPAYLRIEAMGDWGSDKLIAAYTDLGFPANAVRITRSATTTFLEVNFTSTILGASMRVVRLGFDSTVSVLSGALSAGGGTVQETLTIAGKINAASMSIAGNTVLHAGNYTSYAVPTSRTISINGTSYDLSADRSWTITASETDTLATVTARGATTTGAITVSGRLTANGAGTYAVTGSSTQRYIIQALNTSNSVNSSYGWWWFHNANGDMGFHADAVGDILTLTRGGGASVNGNTILTAGNYTSYSPSLTGSGASGTWGINISGKSETVTINYNNDSNSTYQLLWGSGNSVYGTAQVYVNPSSDVIYARGGYISPGNPWGTSDSAYFPNGITTAGGQNWIYGNTYLGNAPSNGSGAEVSSSGRIYVRNGNTSGTWGYAGLFIDRNNAANNYVPWSFENEYGNHSWGIVARFHITSSVGDRPSIQFSHNTNNTRWSIGYCYPDDNFRITQNHGYRPDNSTNDGWGTERFRVNTDGNTLIFASLGIGGITPDVRLSVNGDAHVSSILYLAGSAGSVGSWGTRTYGTNGDWTTNARTIRFDNVGYGTSWSVTIGTSGNLQAYSYQGNANVSGTGNASYHPSGIYSTGTNWLYGTMYMNNNSIRDVQEVYNNGWFRTVGNQGLHNPTNDAHFYPNNASYGSWRIDGSKNGWHGLHFASGTTLMMNSNESGHHREGYGWQFRWYNGSMYVSTSSYGGGSEYQVIHGGNIGSQSVSYASSAGSASNATTLAGIGISTIRGGISSNNYDFYVNGDANTYYPVVLSLGGQYGMHRYSISRGYSDPAPWDPIGTGSHRGGLTLTFDCSSDIAWGGNDKSWRIIQFAEQYTNMVAGMALPVTDGIIVWLRGGGAYYRFHGPSGINHGATVYYSGYTAANGAVYSVRTNLNSVDGEIRAKWPIRGYGDGDMYVNNNAVIHAGGGTITGDLVFNNLRCSADQSYGFIGRNVYADTVNGRGSDPLELCYYDGGGVIIGSGGSKSLTAGSVTSNGLIRVNSNTNLYLDYNHGQSIVGVYSSYRYQGVYSMGDAYKLAIDGTTPGNLYGLSWSHPNAGGQASRLNDHGLMVMINGVTQSAFSSNIWAAGDITAYSDIRVKDDIKTIDNAVHKVKAIRGVTFTRNDMTDSTTRHAGVIAQEVLQVLPEVVTKDGNDHYSVAYGNLNALLIEAIKEQQKQIEELQNKLDNVLSSR